METKTYAPYSTNLKNMSDMKNWVGKELGLSDWITITQENIDTFAKVTQDEQWIHVDVERSKKESPFGQPIAHGFFVLSFASRFAYDCFTVDDIKMGVNYGLNKVRFANHTPVNSRIRGRVSLLEYVEKSKGSKYIIKIIFEIEGQEKPACVAEFVALGFV